MTHSTFRKIFLAAMVPLCLSASVVHADAMQTLNLKQQTTHYMNMNKQIKTIAIGDPNIATVVQMPSSASEFLIITKKETGSTALFVWTIDGARYAYTIVVSPEKSDQAKLIEEAIGLPNVHVKMVDKRILLTGTVENQYEKNRALQTARLYVDAGTESSLLVGSGFDMKLETSTATDTGRSEDVEAAKSEAKGKIIDLIQILHPTQIRLEAQIIEINADKTKDLGFQYGQSGSGGIFTFGEDHDRTETTETYTYIDSDGQTQVATYNYGSDVTPFYNNPLKWISQRFGPINATIRALVSQGKARILSRPSVMTLSGEAATIQIGGQIPYTTTNSNGTNTNFKDYGIILQFKPVVDAQGRINSVVHAEVSNIGGQAVNGQPIITTRSADSVISIYSGSSIVIGGLMDSSETKTVSKIPLLGDIPILGEFFKHTSKSRDKRELIIVVTPRIVDNVDSSHAPMTDAMRQWYEQERLYREAMRDFNFNTANKVPDNTNSDLPPSDVLNSGRETDKPFSK